MTTFLILLAGMALMLALVVAVQRFARFPAQRPADYAAMEPAFDIRQHLSGPIACEGVIYGPMGRVTSRFTAKMHGTWDGDSGTLAEHFRYDSGTTQDREWRLTLQSGGRIRAEADDLVGRGEGTQKGAAVQLRYTIRLPDSAGGHALDVTDWLYLVDDKTIVNRSQFRKFGIKVAELVATMRKVDP
ncbi:MAG: Protein of unknown function (DUF3833) [Roseibaca calidilacus]|uniref:DUF3833 domain-containing protein n=1 Tax=Roseibaca calidilacus TaxID=1666912 RepID=A0A0P7Z1Q1_9RHOB|nr:DUF3833 domain-containing protein [Roseibaca calidilacus]KPP95602.1 MAG: Protein of unknown function (DUF3833) [Roseibaca calidilacus]CUX82021.1 Protein of unknown function (DUF3833) [Roseibaca calidilacus]